MSNAPFDHRQVIQRLETLGDVLQLVGTSADYATMKTLTNFRTPSAYVLLAQESAAENPPGNSGGRVRQKVDVLVGVVIAVRNYRYDDAEKADALAPILDAVRGVIIGWTPSLPMARPMQFVTGKALDSDSSTLLWADVYATQHSIGNS